MKQFIITAAIAAFLISCNNSSNDTNHSNHDSTSNSSVTKSEEGKPIAQIRPAFANLDGNVSMNIKNIFDHYIHVKTALVNSNPAEAKNGADAILDGMKTFDKSLLPADQKAAYDKSTEGIKASATAIAATNNLEKQREHFAALSTQAYELAKMFGAGKTVYHEHCPMAFDNKGAMWLSESKEVKNPYFGEKMMDCGTVEEIIEK